MAIYLKVNGKKIELVALGRICMRTDLGMKEIGSMIAKMVMDMKYGQMEQITLENINMGKNMDLEFLDGKM